MNTRRISRCCRRSSTSPAAIELLENRTLLAAVTQAIQIDNQAPDVLGEFGDIKLLKVSDDDSTRIFNTDGTQAGTVELADVPGEFLRSDIIGLLNGSLLLRDGDGGTLWFTDGTVAGTQQLASIAAGDEAVEFNGELYFSGTDEDGVELWKTDGTIAGTVQVKDINTGQESTEVPGLYWEAVPGAVSYDVHVGRFSRCVDQAGNVECDYNVELVAEGITETSLAGADRGDRWFVLANFADGSNTGSIQQPFNGSPSVGDESSSPSDFTVFNGELYFAAETPDVGREIWKTDGTEAGTVLAVDVVPGVISTHPQTFLEFDNELFFGSFAYGNMYRTDGTTSGTHKVVSGRSASRPGVVGSFPIAVVNGRLIAQQMGNGGGDDRRRLISLDSADDTTPHAPGIQGSAYGGTSEMWFDGFTVVNDRLIFRRVNREDQRADAAANAGHLWTTDGQSVQQLSSGGFLWNEATGSEYRVLDSLEDIGSFHNGEFYFTTRETNFLFGYPVQTAVYRTDGMQLVRVASDPNPFDGPGANNYTHKNYQVINGVIYYARGSSLYRFNPSGEDFVLASDALIRDVFDFNDELFLNATVDDESALFTVTEEPFRDTVRATGGIGTQPTGTPTISWDDAGSDVRRYEIYINPVGARATASYRHGNLTTTSHIPTTVLADGEYEVWLRVHFDDGSRTRWGGSGELLTVNTGQVPSDDPPEFTSPAGAVSNLRPEISWSAISGAVRYELWVSSATDVTPILHTTDLTSTSYIPEVDLGSGKLRIWVRAHRANSRTKWTATHHVEILHSQVTLTAGTGIQQTLTPTITWADSGAERYDLYINEAGVSGAVYRRQTLTGTSHTLETALAPAKAYQVWMRAHFPDGSRSRWGTATDLFVADGEVLNTTPQLSINGNVLSWTPVQNAVEYRIWINEYDSGSFAHDVQDDRTATIPAITLDHDPGEYRAWVIAIYADGTRSDWSNSVTYVIAEASTESVGDEELVLETLNQQVSTFTTAFTSNSNARLRHMTQAADEQSNQTPGIVSDEGETAEKDTIMIAFAERLCDPEILH
jgi:ELWxxDGT repeat protein